jgi:hypothetical protein
MVTVSGSVTHSVVPAGRAWCVVFRDRWFSHRSRDVDALAHCGSGLGCGGLPGSGSAALRSGQWRSFKPGSVFHASSASSRIKSRCSGQEYELAQEVGFRASIHRHLELLMRFTVPSTAPELYFRVRPATTASRSRRSPAVNERSTGRSESTALIHSEHIVVVHRLAHTT